MSFHHGKPSSTEGTGRARTTMRVPDCGAPALAAAVHAIALAFNYRRKNPVKEKANPRSISAVSSPLAPGFPAPRVGVLTGTSWVMSLGLAA